MGIFALLLLSMSISLAVETQTGQEFLSRGHEVFKAKCSTCHLESIPPQKLAEVSRIVKSGGKPPIKAPPMSEVSARVKKFYPEESSFVEFVKDYITNPSADKGVCKPMAYKIFGVMPPIGKSLKETEKEAVARWLYHRFKDSWEEFIRKNPH